MKRKKRRYEDEDISPNNLIVPSWEKPIPKLDKKISIVSAIAFVICFVIIIAFVKNRIILTGGLVTVFILIMLVTGLLSLVAPIAFLTNKFLRKIYNGKG